MARVPLPYTTKNELGRMLMLEQARRVTASGGGTKPSIRELEQELADYCNVTRDTIHMIKRNINQPSLQLAMKICEFFNCEIEDIFTLTDNPDYMR